LVELLIRQCYHFSMTDVCLVSMPYEGLQYPSLAIGLLLASAKKAKINIKAVYPKFWLAEKIGLKRYIAISSAGGSDNLLPDWTFGKAAFPEFNSDEDAYLKEIFENCPRLLDFLREILGKNTNILSSLKETRFLAAAFIKECAAKIMELQPKIIGCSSSFDQNCASIAVLRAVKEINPAVITLMGGADCETVMGRAKKDFFPWIDFMVSGEGDIVFPKLCKEILKNGGHVNRSFRVAKEVLDLDNLPIPDYGDYFKALKQSALSNSVYPTLSIETSRGCWWKRCTFCGMNKDRMSFRVKTPKRVLDELKVLYERHCINTFIIHDNVLNIEYFKSLLPLLSSNKLASYKMFWEVKSNLSEDMVKVLSNAGVRIIQPGIETLHDELLKLLKKGCSAIQNIALLKVAMENGIIVLWNFLYDIPGEKDECYQEMASWLPLVFHLQPPKGVSCIYYSRFSPYHEDPLRFKLDLSFGRAYSYIYPLSAKDLEKAAYIFEDMATFSKELDGRSGKGKVKSLIRKWKKVFKLHAIKEKGIRLVVEENKSYSMVTDTRPCAVNKTLRLRGLERFIYRECGSPCTYGELLEKVQKVFDGEVKRDTVEKTVEKLVKNKIMLSLSGRLLSLALREPIKELLTKRDFMVGYSIDGKLWQ